MDGERSKWVREAYSHTKGELRLDNVRASLRKMLEKLQKPHDAIHQFVYTPAQITSISDGSQAEIPIWPTMSALIIYHWEAFYTAHRSFLEALSAFYNVAFATLRLSLELIIKGAFYECLARKECRENWYISNKNKESVNLKGFLLDVLQRNPPLENDLREVSGSIFDILAPVIDDTAYRPSFRAIVSQVDHWGMFRPIEDADDLVYRQLYQPLSGDVHVIPDKTDIGRVILTDSLRLFDEPKVRSDILEEHADYLKRVMDVGIVVTLNLLENIISSHDWVKDNLRNLIVEFQALELPLSSYRARGFVE